MSDYDNVLADLKLKGERLANQYVLELYNILRYEEKLQPEDCRAKIEHDCLDLWSRATIRKYLPPEAMNPKKQTAGKIGADEKKRKKKEVMLAVVGNENTTSTELEESYPINQTEHDSARFNLAENDSNSPKEEESMSFSRELDQQLSKRTLSPELLEANRIIADRDKQIEELKELLSENRLGRGQTSSSPSLLPSNLTKLIRHFRETDFILEHNGYEVISVQPARKDEISASAATTTAAARLSQTSTSNNNQIQQ